MPSAWTRCSCSCRIAAPEGPFSTNVLWNRAIEEGRLYGVAFTGQWFEVGNPQAIAPTEAALKDA